jgi:hypothetical protein
MATTTGFVQSSFLAPGPLACASIGPAPNSTEVVFTRDAAFAAVLSQAQATGREVDVTHPDDSAEISTVATRPCDPAASPLHLDGIEVTQSVQDLAQSVPLIAGKATVVRVFLGNSTAAPMTVRGRIAVRRGPDDPVTVVASIANAVLDPAHAGDVPAQRNRLGRSLDFALPQAVTGDGPLTVALSAVIDVGTGAPVAVGCRREPAVWFHRSPPLRIRVLGMRYALGGVTHVPSTLDVDFLFSWLRRAYPVGQLVQSQSVVTAIPAAPFDVDDINAQVAAIRAIDVDAGEDNRTHYYGFVSDVGFFMRGGAAVPPTADPTAIASGPTGATRFPWDTDGSYGDWYAGHELGHTFGRRHPGFCGESPDDLADYPFPGGTLAGRDDSFCGYDVGDPALGLPRAVLPGLDWTDVMTYCDDEWLSPYTYQGIRTRLLEEDALGSRPAAGAAPAFDATAAEAVAAGAGGRPDPRGGPPVPEAPRPDDSRDPGRVGGTGSLPRPTVVSVVATVDPTRRSGRIAHVHPVPSTAPTAPDPSSPFALRVLGADGTALATTPVPVTPQSREDPGAGATGLVAVAIALPAGAAALELRTGDRPLDVFRAADPGGTEPSAPLRGEVSGSDVVLDLGREARPGTGYVVQVSDDGRRWRAVALGGGARFAVDRREARDGSLRVRVTQTDGFTSTVVAERTIRV